MERLRKKIAREKLATCFSQTSVIFILLYASTVSAVTETAENNFQKGIKSFKTGEYQLAEQYFLEAKNQGYTALKIDYNLGVATFKQKKYDDAIIHFNKLVSHSQFTTIANYNIGLSLERQANIEEAEKYFKLAANDKANKKIQYLAQRKLDEKEQAPPVEKTKNWDVYASISYGYDDNVELIAQDIASNKGDSYIQSYARAKYKSVVGARAYVSIFDINYNDFDDENYQIVRVGVDYPFNFKDWEITPALEYSESELGDEDYQDITDYRLKARKRFGKNSLTLSYRYSDINAADSQYDYLEGNRQRIRVDYRMPVDIGKLRLRYQFETNDREDTSRRSYSPDRHNIEAKFSYELKKDWDVYVDGNYRHSDYPSKGNYDREDERYRFSVGTEYNINKSWSISAKYEYTDNHSNHSIDEYTRNVYQLSLNGKF